MIPGFVALENNYCFLHSFVLQKVEMLYWNIHGVAGWGGEIRNNSVVTDSRLFGSNPCDELGIITAERYKANKK